MAYVRIASGHLVTGVIPPIYADIDFDSIRSGNTTRNRVRVTMWTAYGTSAWRNDAWQARIQIHTYYNLNITVKGGTSGNINGVRYAAETGYYDVNSNGGTIGVGVQFFNINTGQSLGATWLGSGSLPGVSAPAAPTGLGISPSPALPDKDVVFNWTAASGGTNGVTGYGVEFQVNAKAWVSLGDVGLTSATVTPTKHLLANNDKIRYRVRSRTTVNGAHFYSGYTLSGDRQAYFTPPSEPLSLTIKPNPSVPDISQLLSWVPPTSKGSNGISSYTLEYQINSNNYVVINNLTTTSYTLTALASGIKHGDTFRFRVRAITTGLGIGYAGNYATSSTISSLFVSPSAPTNPILISDNPIPTGIAICTWQAPSNVGSNGISGYKISGYKNNVLSKEFMIGNVTQYTYNLVDSGVFPGDVISFRVQAYTNGNGTNYYSPLSVSSASITVITDKFIYASVNGSALTKYKAYVITGTKEYELKKELFSIIK